HGPVRAVGRLRASDRLLCPADRFPGRSSAPLARHLARAAPALRVKPRVFVDAALEHTGEVSLEDAAAHHLARVLRLREGDTLTVFNGRGGEWAAEFIGRRRGGPRHFAAAI